MWVSYFYILFVAIYSTSLTLLHPSWLSMSYFLFGCAIPYRTLNTLNHSTCKRSILTGSFTLSYSILLLGLAPKIDLLIHTLRVLFYMTHNLISLKVWPSWSFSQSYLHQICPLSQQSFFSQGYCQTHLFICSPNTYNLQACHSFILATYLLKSMLIIISHIRKSLLIVNFNNLNSSFHAPSLLAFQ